MTLGESLEEIIAS